MSLDNKEENLLGKRRKSDNPEKRIAGMFVHNEKSLYLEGTLDQSPSVIVFEEKLMQDGDCLILGETTHGEKLSLGYYKEPQSETISFGEVHRESSTYLIKEVIKNIHTHSLDDMLLEIIEVKVENIDKFFKITPDEERNSFLGNPGDININTIGSNIELFNNDGIKCNLEYFYDRFSAERKIKLVLFSTIDGGSKFSLYLEKITGLIRFFHFAIEEDLYIKEIIGGEKRSGSKSIYINLFNNKYFGPGCFKKGIFDSGKHEKIYLTHETKDNIRNIINRRFVLNKAIGHVISSYLFYTGSKNIGLQDYFLGLSRSIETLHRCLFITPKKTDKKEELNSIINILKESDKLDEKRIEYYENNLVLKDNEKSLKKKFFDIKSHYSIGDNVINDREIDECVVLRNELTHKTNKSTNIEKEFNLSRKLYYFMRLSLIYLINIQIDDHSTN